MIGKLLKMCDFDYRRVRRMNTTNSNRSEVTKAGDE